MMGIKTVSPIISNFIDCFVLLFSLYFLLFCSIFSDFNFPLSLSTKSTQTFVLLEVELEGHF